MANNIIDNWDMDYDEAIQYAHDLLRTPIVDLTDEEMDFLREFYFLS